MQFFFLVVIESWSSESILPSSHCVCFFLIQHCSIAILSRVTESFESFTYFSQFCDSRVHARGHWKQFASRPALIVLRGGLLSSRREMRLDFRRYELIREKISLDLEPSSRSFVASPGAYGNPYSGIPFAKNDDAPMYPTTLHCVLRRRWRRRIGHDPFTAKSNAKPSQIVTLDRLSVLRF